MSIIKISGSNPLKGDIKIHGAKNATLPILACSLLTSDTLYLSNVPKLTDIDTMLTLLTRHGAVVEQKNNSNQSCITINCNDINNCKADYDLVSKMRASIWVLGPLIARFGQAEVALPGGCRLGARQIDLHLAILTAMGAVIELRHGYLHAHTKNNSRLKGTNFYFNIVSVGATITAIMAATLADGYTVLGNCAQEPEIVDMCNCLVAMGANIEGIGSSELKITGVNKLRGTSYSIIADRIEAGTYMIAAAITKGELKIYNIDYHIVENLALKLIETGIEVNSCDDHILVRYNGKLKSVNIQTGSYPGFATDMQAQFMSLMTLSDGVSLITENIFENRFMHVPELSRMGANISVSGNNAVVQGTNSLNGADVMASDLRASVSLILAGLAAKGTTRVSHIHHLDRGYQDLELTLRNCGADITRIHDKT